MIFLTILSNSGEFFRSFLMPSVYDYMDYRVFLKDDFFERKERNSRFSYRSAANRIGINCGTLVRILNGQRNLTSKTLPRFIEYLGLKNREAEYFSLLVDFNQSKKSKAQRDMYQKLIDYRNTRKRDVSGDQYEYFSRWYYVVIRELLKAFPERLDKKGLAELLEPEILPSEAAKGIEVLKKLGFLEEGSDETVTITDKYITTGEKWESPAIHDFQISMMQKGIEALDTQPKEERDFSTVTVSLPEKALDEVRDVLKRARDEILDIEDSYLEKDRVYQINLGIFPVSKRIPTQGRVE